MHFKLSTIALTGYFDALSPYSATNQGASRKGFLAPFPATEAPPLLVRLAN